MPKHTTCHRTISGLSFKAVIYVILTRFQLSGQVRGQISAAHQEKGIVRLENIILVSSQTFPHLQMSSKSCIRTTRWMIYLEVRFYPVGFSTLLNTCIARSDLVNRLPRAMQAGYNSGRAGGPLSCFAGTRVAVLETVKAWLVDSNESQPRVFWLNGLAGIGKSTIAKTIAEYAYDCGILGGSFFFSQDDQQLRDSSLVFPTLAFQLAQSTDIFKSSIGEALQKDADYGLSQNFPALCNVYWQR